MKIDLFVDIVCPWCRIGKQHLFQAMEQWSGEAVEVNIHAYQLDPNMPAEGVKLAKYFEKFGNPGMVKQMTDRVCEAGAQCGLHFDFNHVDHMPNTLRSHQLIKLAPAEQKLTVLDGLYEAYFTKALDVYDMDVILDVAEQAGMERADTRARLEAGEGTKAVKEDLEFARRVGIQGVPFFIINDKYALSGAQPVEAFLNAFEKVGSQTS